jgi:hypothetical protein
MNSAGASRRAGRPGASGSVAADSRGATESAAVGQASAHAGALPAFSRASQNVHFRMTPVAASKRGASYGHTHEQ